MCGDEESRSLLGNRFATGASPALFCIVLRRWSAGDGEYSLALMASKARGVVGYIVFRFSAEYYRWYFFFPEDRGIKMMTIHPMSSLLHDLDSNLQVGMIAIE